MFNSHTVYILSLLHIEEYFFTRLAANRAVCIPGHGQHLTGLGHVEDLAIAMTQVIGKDVTKGQIYNIQDTQSVTFTGRYLSMCLLLKISSNL